MTSVGVGRMLWSVMMLVGVMTSVVNMGVGVRMVLVLLVDPQGIVDRGLSSALGSSPADMMVVNGRHFPHGVACHPVEEIRSVFTTRPEFAPSLM